MNIDQDKVSAFADRVIAYCAATAAAPLTMLGDRLGLWKAMAGAGPLTSHQLAERSGCVERYVREWLCAQAVAGYVRYDPPSRAFTLSDEAALVLADDNSPLFLGGFLQVAHGLAVGGLWAEAAFRGGAVIPADAFPADLGDAMERLSGPIFRGELTASWIPALDGVEARLHSGASVADVGCGRGTALIVMAQAYPKSRFVGFDVDEASVGAARDAACAAGVADRVQFEVAEARSFSGEARLREVLTAAGFVKVDRVAEAMMNMVLEAR